MKSKYIVLIFSIALFGNVFSQSSNCFEIQSILVDACGTPEGENEMVRFEVGQNNLNVNNLTVNWPNNPFQGICQNTTTQNTVAYMNSTIQSCGYFLEPISGTLPANSKVLLITSSDFDATSHSYAGLEDTVYVIFQCSGNSQGHFANWTNGCNPASGVRTLTLDFGSGCAQTVSYNKCDLLNQTGGIGGTSAERDGAKVNFDINGNPTYVNEGCVIPYSSVEVEANLLMSNGEICPGESVNLSGMVNNSTNYEWSSSDGLFSDSQSLMTEFTDDSSSSGSYYIYLSAENGCENPISDSILITVLEGPNVFLDSTVLSMDSCAINEVLLEVSGADQYSWSTGASGSSITVDETGYYSVVGENECGTAQSEIFIDTETDCEDPPTDTDTTESEVLNVEIPNVFTPNKDGSNDYFGIWTNLEVSIDYILLNRWGNTVKKGKINSSTLELNKFWDGNINGHRASEGTYFYKIEVTSKDSTKRQYQGFFHLAR